MHYSIKTDGCATGYGYVIDYMGNIWFYGSVDDCQHFIEEVEGYVSN